MQDNFLCEHQEIYRKGVSCLLNLWEADLSVKMEPLGSYRTDALNKYVLMFWGFGAAVVE